MDIEIVDAPIRFHLHGRSSPAPNKNFGEVGMALMNQMWKLISDAGTPHHGINHWVYLADCTLFTGVELQRGAAAPAGLEPLDVDIPRYARHLHVGPYQALPDKWAALKDELFARGETIGGAPSVEIYGHHSDDPATTETTIVIALQPQVV